jgi:hypothetical protein
MLFTKTIQIPADEAQQMQEFLNSKGEDKVATIATYTADFGYVDEGVYGNRVEVDIKVCQGDPPFVDPVLFINNCDSGCLDSQGDLLGEYCFMDIYGNDYTVILEADYSQRN